jgi:tRNA pseudouridine13 synthase
LRVPKLERQIGIEAYATSSLGIGGMIKRSADDFVVEEMLVDGSKANVNHLSEMNPLGSSSVKNRFLMCVLVKRNWDTISAVKAGADQLGTTMDRIQFAGLKDAKAITGQHVTIEGAVPEDIGKVHVKDVELRPVGYLRNGISQFYLLGNSFHVRISRIDHDVSTVKSRIENVIEQLDQGGGFPNFFGHQRFGTIRPITHQVGKAIIKGNFKKAAMLYLAKPSPLEHSESRQARKTLRATGDFREALKNYPKQLRYERSMLVHLVRKPDDYVGAFRRLPLKLLELFPQAYQSYLFNKFLSRRLARGVSLNRVEVGDYALSVERSGLPMLAMRKMVKTENAAEINAAIQTGRMVLAVPLFGYKHRHSIGINGEIEKRIFEEEKISLSSFKVDAVPEVSLKGRSRAAMASLNDFRLEEIVSNQRDSTKLVASMSFTLHRGAYASIVLREFMKPRNLVKAGF